MSRVFDVLCKILFHPLSLPLLLLLLILNRLLRKMSIISKNPPPSPPRLPILGNLHQLGKFPHRALHTLSKQYGGLMSIHIGSAPALVVSSSDAACEIMKTHDVVFANRAKSRATCKIIYGGRDLVFSPYGDFWKQIRSISVVKLLSNKKVQSFRSVREEEVSFIVDIIKRSILSPVNLSEILLMLSSNVLCRTAFGRKYGGESGVNFAKLLSNFVEVIAVFSFGDFIPWLGWIDRVSGFERRVDKVAKDFDNFLERVVQEHVDRLNDGYNDENKDFVDILLDVQNKNPNALPKDSIKAIILDMFAAGTDTTYSLLEWTMTELLGNPRVMKKLQDEVRKAVVRQKPMVDEDDIPKLEYLRAVIKETLRLHPPLPVLLIRESSKEVNVLGYNIPAKTRVIINAWAIQRDPTYWEDPNKFKPERFLKSSVDSKGAMVDYNWIPFGGGRRGCPGISFAFASAELALANLVYAFDWKLPDGVEFDVSNLPEHPGIIVNRKEPLIALANMYSCN